nr:MAG TPA: High molecular weight glutenin subunit [Caudoviricetes sp.]
MTKIVLFTAVAIAMLIVLINSFQVRYTGKHRKKVRL